MRILYPDNYIMNEERGANGNHSHCHCEPSRPQSGGVAISIYALLPPLSSQRRLESIKGILYPDNYSMNEEGGANGGVTLYYLV